MDDVILAVGDIVKISRNAERFWNRVMEDRGATLLVKGDNMIVDAPFHYGQGHEISRDEIIEIIPSKARDFTPPPIGENEEE